MATMRAESLAQLIHCYLFASELGNEIDSEGTIRKVPKSLGPAAPHFSRLAARLSEWSQSNDRSL
jgi:hypothetical protein